MTQCNARSKRSGEQCKKAAVSGGSKCHIHGGVSLIGVAHPNFKSGRYSKHLPSRLAERYGEALGDPQLLELRDEIALVGTRQSELLERLDSGLTLGRWFAAQAAHQDLLKAIRDHDSKAVEDAISALGNALDTTENEGAIWSQVIALGEQRRKLAESEQKRMLAAQQLISAEQGMALVARLTESVRRYVSDPSILAAIANDLRAVITEGAGGRS